MIFLKHFDTTRQSLFGIGKIHMPRASKVSDLIPIINERMRWASGTPLKLYEVPVAYFYRPAPLTPLSKEIKPSMIELMKPKYTFTQSEIQDGDIICFQVDISDKEIHDLESQGLYSNPPQFYDFLQNRVMVLFRPKFDDPDTEQPEFSLVLSKKQNYDAVSLTPQSTSCYWMFLTYLHQMASKVGEYLKHEAIKLRFTTTHAANGTPKSILKRSLNQSITEIISPSYVVPSTTVILYEKLDVSIVELETKRSLKVIWTGIHNREESTHTFLLPKTSMVHELADILSKQVTMSSNGQGSGKIRVFEVSKDGKTQREFTGTEMIGNIPDPVELYADVKKLVVLRVWSLNPCL